MGFGLDEGVVSPTDEFLMFYAEQIKTAAEFTVRGQAGHGSQFLENTAGEKVSRLLAEIYAHRAEEFKKSKGTTTDQKNVGVANLTMMRGGLQDNVVFFNF